MPMDNEEPTNEQRASWADQALEAYAIAKGEAPDECDITDLLTDLMHLCQQEGHDFDRHLSMATDHFSEERTDQ